MYKLKAPPPKHVLIVYASHVFIVLFSSDVDLIVDQICAAEPLITESKKLSVHKLVQSTGSHNAIY